MSERWTAELIPDQSGRTALITGASSGLGLAAATELARHGATVVLACRDQQKGAAARERVQAAAPDATVEVEQLDLAELASVAALCARMRARADGLDVLINNAGVMAPPRRQTADGFELQLGTNHLGHFALTAGLLELMEGRGHARVVTVSSNAHKMGSFDFEDLQSERGYRRWSAYGRSKLANLSFALELDRRLRAAGSSISSLAAHPGYAATNLQFAAPPALDRIVMLFTNMLVAQSAEMGSLPLLYAATDPEAEGGSYIGPDGPGEFRGHPHLATPSAAARDERLAARLWEASEELTGAQLMPHAAPARGRAGSTRASG
jgi:NAD(P)-dependent dehydrogenase (short-subunit alcohol dehydrogenase family)